MRWRLAGDTAHLAAHPRLTAYDFLDLTGRARTVIHKGLLEMTKGADTAWRLLGKDPRAGRASRARSGRFLLRLCGRGSLLRLGLNGLAS